MNRSPFLKLCWVSKEHFFAESFRDYLRLQLLLSTFMTGSLLTGEGIVLELHRIPAELLRMQNLGIEQSSLT